MKLYTAEWCGPCKGIKQWLATQSYDIEYVDIDKLEERPVWLRSVPTLDADGKQYLGAGIREYLEGCKRGDL